MHSLHLHHFIMKIERDSDLLELLSYAKENIEGIPLLKAFIAYAYERTEQYEDAYESYQEAYSEMKEDHEFLANYANFLLEEGKRNEGNRNSTSN